MPKKSQAKARKSPLLPKKFPPISAVELSDLNTFRENLYHSYPTPPHRYVWDQPFPARDRAGEITAWTQYGTCACGAVLRVNSLGTSGHSETAKQPCPLASGL
jgi:hypothetical protein